MGHYLANSLSRNCGFFLSKKYDPIIKQKLSVGHNVELKNNKNSMKIKEKIHFTSVLGVAVDYQYEIDVTISKSSALHSVI